MNELLRKLSGDDLRSDGRANEVAEEVEKTCAPIPSPNIFFSV
jgi:hypothetical protein